MTIRWLIGLRASALAAGVAILLGGMPGATAQTPQPAAPSAAPSPAAVLPAQNTALLALDPSRLSLDQLDAAIRRDSITDEDLRGMRSSVDPVRDELREQVEHLERSLNDVDARLKQVGAAPAAGAPPEDPTIAAERTRLTQRRTDVDAALKQARLLQLRADDLVDRIVERRRALFTRQLLNRTASALDPAFWKQATSSVPDGMRGLRLLGESWWNYARDNGGYGGMAAAIVALIGLAVAAAMARRWWRRRPIRPTAGGTRFIKSALSLIDLIRFSVVTPAMVAAVLLVLQAFGLMPPRIMEMAFGLFVAVAVASVGRGIAFALFAPRRPSRRFVDVGDETAARLSSHLIAAARTLGVVIFINVVQKALVAPVAATIAMSAVLSAVIAGLLIDLLLRLGRDGGKDENADAESSDGASAPEPRIGQWLRGGGWVLAGAIIVAMAAGYIGFAAFLAGRFLVALAVIGALYIALEFVDALFTEVLTAHTRRGRAVAATFGLKPQNVDLIGTLMSALLRLMLVFVAIFPLLGPGGIFAADIFGVAREAAFGIRIGEFTISLSALLSAVVVLLIGILLTRAAQGWLQRRLLPRTAMEPSLQHSVAAIFGYIGIVTTISIAMASLGIDLQKIAFVAGALSVGIGFGLQAIVSNFVSGLIVLAERPVRVGDLIEVKGERGRIRRIRVRATEVDTGDGVSLVVPNSELITGVVKNWTRFDTQSRVAVQVTVAYDSDPEQVRTILLDVVRQHRGVVAAPAPIALLTGFGPSGLDFELGFTVANLDQGGLIRSDLRFEILKRFRAEGVVIAVPRQDVRVRQEPPPAIVS